MTTAELCSLGQRRRRHSNWTFFAGTSGRNPLERPDGFDWIRWTISSEYAKVAHPWVAAMVRSIFAQPGSEEVWAQDARVVEQLEKRFPAAAELLESAASDILAFTTFPKPIWREVVSNNPLERLNREIRRRTDVVGIFPARASIIRLTGAVLLEQNDEWMLSRRYMSVDVLRQAQANQQAQSNEGVEPVLVGQLTA